jgi:DnaK suppressor protein
MSSSGAKAPKKAIKKKIVKSAKSSTPAKGEAKEASRAGPAASQKTKAVNQKTQTPIKKAEKKPPMMPKVPPKGIDKSNERVADKITEKMVSGKKHSEGIKSSLASKSPESTPKQLPIKVEPKIIETQEFVYRGRVLDEQLFSKEELETFRELLTSERGKILVKAKRAMEDGNIHIDKNEMFDEVDQAAAMIDQNLTFRLLDRDRKLLQEIDHALAKIDTGDYGYCEGTGEPIPKRRLELRPWCRHSVKYKERLERMKKSGRGVVDEDEL